MNKTLIEEFKEGIRKKLNENENFSKLPNELQNKLIENLFLEFTKNNIFALTELEKITQKSKEKYIDSHINEISILKSKLMELFDKYFLLKNNGIFNAEKISSLKSNLDSFVIFINAKIKNTEKLVLNEDLSSELTEDEIFIDISHDFLKNMPESNMEEILWHRAIGYDFYIQNLLFIKSGLMLINDFINFDDFLTKNLEIIVNYKPIERVSIDLLNKTLVNLRKYRFDNNSSEENQKTINEYKKTYEKVELEYKELNEKIKQKTIVIEQNSEINHAEFAEILDLQMLASNYKFILSEINVFFCLGGFYVKSFNKNEYLAKIREKVEKDKEVDIDIKKIIENGENNEVEFKSTMIWDIHQSKSNSALTDKIGEEIVAFLNTNGGKLLIGVEDNKNIFGVEKDLAFVKHKNIDGFLLKIGDLIKEKIGLEFSSYINCKIYKIENKDICLVNVKKSKNFAYFNGAEFFIRAENSIRKLNAREAIEYTRNIKENFV